MRTINPRFTNTFRVILIIAIASVAITSASADTCVKLEHNGAIATSNNSADETPEVNVLWYDNDGVDIVVRVSEINLRNEITDGGEFLRATIPGSPITAEQGQPALPVVRRLFMAPTGANVAVDVEKQESTTIDLRSLGFANPIVPMQVPFSMDLDARNTSLPLPEALLEVYPEKFAKDNSAYNRSGSLPIERIKIRDVGIARRQRIMQLEISPVTFNPSDQSLTVYHQMNIKLRFDGGEMESLNRPVHTGFSHTLLNPAKQSSSRETKSENLLILAAEDFAGSTPLNQFVDAKTDQGFNVTVVSIPDHSTRWYVKMIVEQRWGTANEPDYVLLVGDAYSDGPYSGTWYLPVWIGQGAHSPCTDMYYVCMDGLPSEDWFPDIPIGRFPVRTVDELQNIVDKVIYVESGQYADPTYTNRATFLASPDPYANSEDRLDNIIQEYMEPFGIQSTRLYTESLGSDTQDVADALNAGTFLASFFGHAAGYQAWGSPSFDFDDIEALTNVNAYPFIISFTCSPAAFHYTSSTGSPGFLEKWLTVPNKGASAGYGSTTQLYSYEWSTWGNLQDFLYNAIYTDGIRELGPAFQTASAQMVAYYGVDDPVSRDWSESFLLLGDPSMTLPIPPKENYLIITPPFFSTMTALSDFEKAKEKQGMKVSTYVVPSGTSNSAIKAYIQGLWGTDDQPDYILLVGDTDGHTSTNDSIPHWEGTGDKSAPTDNTYVCMDGTNDWYPDIPIGRFSVETEAQLNAIVKKTTTVQSGSFPDPDYVKRGTFLANPSTYNTAEPTHDWVVENYFDPIGYQANKIYASEGGGTADVAAALNAGSLFTVYLGHSGSTRWWDPEFSQSDVNALHNEGLYGLAFGWSCNTAAFTGSSECIAETWIRAADKGAAAYISASTYIYWGSVEDWLPSSIHEKSFFAAFFEDDIWHIGKAWQAGLYRFLTEYGQWDGDPTHGPQQHESVIHNFFEEFVLFGDPALKLPQAADFTVDATPDPIDLCCTSNGRAVCIIGVGQKGRFSENVTLDVTGAPNGATSSFHANHQSPPFTSILAIDGVTPAMAGNYQLQISATATGGWVRSTTVDLNIASSLPSTVSLSTPNNEQTEVSRTPTLTWQQASEASTYDVELSLSPTFSTVVSRATVTDTSYMVDTTLQSNTQYYWRVKASNGCGESEYSSVFSFTTIEQADYFTQQFTSGFDLDNTSIELSPDGSGDYYEVCRSSITTLPTDPDGGTAIPTDEDFSVSVTLSGGKEVDIYGHKYSTFHIGENGYITFGGSDTDWDETLNEHFSMRRISALYNDLSTPAGGTISWKQLSDSVVVTWDDVPEYNTSNSNTMQIEMSFGGKIIISWLTIDSDEGIVGISNGNGMPDDFFPSDLSESQDCTMDPGFEMNASPQSRDICVPDDADYQISVTPVLGFTETVTLSVSGVPAGATAVFSTNGQVPPFASTLTVSGTESCAAGTYDINVTGTATGGLQRYANVQLGISASTPDPVTLTSPVNGLINASRTPRLVWQESPGAFEYFLQIATDRRFNSVVYSRRLTQANHIVETILDGSTTHYWHVRATNDCGESEYSDSFSFTTSNMLLPTAYDMPNGQAGTYNYFDSSYDGNGDPETPLSPLSGGLGELTDGVVATQHWNQTSTPYVGWHTVDPTITFHFAEPVSVGQILLHLDDSGGGGGVYPPDDITVSNETASRVFTVTDPAGDEPFWFTCDNVNMVGDTFHVTLADYNSSGGYIMLSEVEFRGAPVGACCSHGMCTLSTENECDAQGGTYHGNGSDCYPDPCVTYHPECVIISEVVQGTESGDCPRWIEITNTGTSDFAFLEGGIIVQSGNSSDVTIDVDLTDVIIEAGQSFVVNSNVGGVCTGAFPGVYGEDPDFITEVAFGFGDERFILTNTDDSSNLIDIYGQFGTDGTGTPWEFTDGYSYRLPAWSAGAGHDFNSVEWQLGGPGSLAGANPTELLLTETSPGTHVYDEPCSRIMLGDIDGDLDVDLDDCALMCDCMDGPDRTDPPIGCPSNTFAAADLDQDGDVDLTDFAIMQAVFAD